MIKHQLLLWPVLLPETSPSTLSPFSRSLARPFFPPTAPGSPDNTRRFFGLVDRCRVCAGEPDGLTASDDRLRGTDGFRVEFLDDGRGLLTSDFSAAVAFEIFFLGLAAGGVVVGLFWDFALEGVEADFFLILVSGGLDAIYFLGLTSDVIDDCLLVGGGLFLSLALDGVDAGFFLSLAFGGFDTSLLGLSSDGVDTAFLLGLTSGGVDAGRLLDLVSDGVDTADPLLGLASCGLAAGIVLDLVTEGTDPGLAFDWVGVFLGDLEIFAFDDEFGEDSGGLVGSGTENLRQIKH